MKSETYYEKLNMILVTAHLLGYRSNYFQTGMFFRLQLNGLHYICMDYKRDIKNFKVITALTGQGIECETFEECEKYVMGLL